MTLPATATPDLMAALSANPWFGALAPRERRALLAAGAPLHLRRGEMLFRQGDAPGGFYAVTAGLLKASSLREDGREAILAVLEPGNWFGEISLLDHLPRTHDATALTDAAVLVVHQPAFARLMQRAAFAQAVAALLAARVRGLYAMMEDATLRSTRARVARRLAQLAHGDATMAPEARAVVSVSQEALAMMLGLTRQTLNKELKALVAEGAVALGYGRIEIVSPQKLQALGARS
ncbi:Crp/Fnr family transcriptional regulator [Variovorax terrae]|uniref:Crp/Fnr family transcriptional regulator n=1 Tax=Variovorax terrae TaxID=2923278 RepID=A0A9X1VZ87_9BURK|nr:Crp/Fnr family transcriptional regulator [Variovorax terrae]MCJ0765624.1 Crp/Fnr family transcriptional regulator [Variovorax terrae]